MFIGYHASHEQFSPRTLLDLVPLVEQAGFSGILSSDHIAPWITKQGESGHNWSWLGAAMGKASLPFGSLVIPGGWRYHPAVAAQAVATLAQMYPQQLPWVAAGSGEYMNEHVAAAPWPEKEERNRRLEAASNTMRALWRGEEVHMPDGPVPTRRARLWSLPEAPPAIYAAALSVKTARWAGAWADGLITVRLPHDEAVNIINAFREGGGEGKPVVLQLQLSWAYDIDKAKKNAWEQWRHVVLGPDQLADLETPEDFERACADATIEDVAENIPAFSHAHALRDYIMSYADLGYAEIYLHNAGRNQREFIEFCGANILRHMT